MVPCWAQHAPSGESSSTGVSSRRCRSITLVDILSPLFRAQKQKVDVLISSGFVRASEVSVALQITAVSC